jgi:dUTPase
MAETIKFLKTRDVLDPVRSYPTDAGIDFFVPKFTKKFITDLKEKNKDLFKEQCEESGCCSTITFSGGVSGSSTQVNYDLQDKNKTHFKFNDAEGKLYFNLPPHTGVTIPSGLHSRMSEYNRALIAANRSGIASKYGLVFGSQVVDSSYKGEIHINVINTSTKNVRIYEDMKLMQFIETPIFANPIEITDDSDCSSKGTKYIEFYQGLVDDRKDSGFGSTN